MLKLDNVLQGGEEGAFRANAESMGWRRADGGRMVVHQTSTVKQAEWREGSLRVLCQAEDEEGNVEDVMFGLDGIDNAKFDDLWRFFEKNCGVYVKKHKVLADVSGDDFDAAMRGVEAAADKVDDAANGSVSKKAREADLMKRVEAVRDGLDQAVSGDKQALSRVFAENGCERIGRLRLVVDTVNLEVYQKDPRWLHLANLAATVESVLKELGKFRVWKPPASEEDSSMQRRQMVRELRQRSGEDGEGEEAEAAAATAAAAASASSSSVPNPLASGPRKLNTENMPMPVFAGLLPPSSSSDVPYKAPAEEVPPPAPVEEPAEVVERTGSEGGAPEEDWDVEVDNPNAVQASAPDGGKKDEQSGQGDTSRIRYIYQTSIREGWVWKRSQYLKKWRRRWLVLQPDHIATYKQRSVGGQTERIDKGTLVHIYAADAEVMQTKAFCISASQKRTFGTRSTKLYMVCDTEKQRDLWMKAIQETLK